jgi:hypothetical protein
LGTLALGTLALGIDQPRRRQRRGSRGESWRRAVAVRAPGWRLLARGVAAVAFFLAAVVTEIYLCDVCFCYERLRPQRPRPDSSPRRGGATSRGGRRVRGRFCSRVGFCSRFGGVRVVMIARDMWRCAPCALTVCCVWTHTHTHTPIRGAERRATRQVPSPGHKYPDRTP